jgi:pSer/pThr/pTyr-binding forkhead associated (FHA) protein
VRPLGTARVLGKLKPIEIVDVLWQEDLAHVTTVQRVVQMVAEEPQRSALTLRFKSQVFELDELSQPFTIGRDAGNSLVVETEWVSRNHALIEWKRGYFSFADRSTNGTWIRIGDDDELFVHRDEVRLRRGGTISIGQAHQLESLDLIGFQCSDGDGG